MKGPEAAMVAGVGSQEYESQRGENKNSMSRVNRIGLEQVLLFYRSTVGQLGTGGAWAAEFKGPEWTPVSRIS